MSLREVCYKLGITEERDKTISGLIHGCFKVIRKETCKNEYMPEEHYIVFNDKTHTIRTINDGWFEIFNKGDLVDLDYRFIRTNIKDYIPPNFDQKRLVRVEEKYCVEKAEKHIKND
jgi:hypothetical protein